MKQNSTHRQYSNGFVYAMIMIGAGLILFGFTLFMFLRPTQSGAQEYSAIPQTVNYPAPELVVTDLNGTLVSLRDYSGKVMLVNLWATWCPPCKAEMPTLEAFYQKYKHDNFVIIGINDGETYDLVEKFVEDYGLTVPVWLDEQYLSEKAFKTINLPSSYVIDRDGTVRLMWIGAISRNVLEKFVSPIIKE